MFDWKLGVETASGGGKKLLCIDVEEYGVGGGDDEVREELTNIGPTKECGRDGNAIYFGAAVV